MWVLETERLRLRQTTLDDVDDLLGILGDPEAMRFYPAPKTREETAGWIRWCLDSYERYGFGLWISVLKQGNRFVGDCGLVMQPVENQLEVEIGYHTLRTCWGQGFASEAARACRDYAFNTLGYQRVVSIVDPQNYASRRVAEKVHSAMRMFTWAKNNKEMCLYFTERGMPTDSG